MGCVWRFNQPADDRPDWAVPYCLIVVRIHKMRRRPAKRRRIRLSSLMGDGMNITSIRLACRLMIRSPAAIVAAAMLSYLLVAGTANAAVLDFEDISVGGGFTPGSKFLPTALRRWFHLVWSWR